MVLAQEIYDLRELTGFISGTDLHDFFREVVNDPSPSGYTEIKEDVILRHNLGIEIMTLLNSPTRSLLADIRQYIS